MNRRQWLFKRVGRKMEVEKIFYEDELRTFDWTEDSRVERISPVHKSPSLPRKYPAESTLGDDGAKFTKVGGAPEIGGTGGSRLPSSVTSESGGRVGLPPSGRSLKDRACDKVESATVQLPRWRVVAEAMDPLMFLFCLYGVLPLAFKPLRVSLHPFRSSLLYALTVFCLVTWSVWMTVKARMSMLVSSNECMDQRIMAMQALAHVAAHIFVPIAWLEARVLRDRHKLWDRFAVDYGHLVSCRLPPKTRYISRILAFTVLVIIPVGVCTWILVLHQIGSEASHALAHTHVTAVCLLLCSLFSVGCRSINDLASDISTLLNKMVSEKRVTAEKLVEYRSAWLSLRELLSSAGGLSIGALLFLLYLLVLITLSLYQFLAAVSSGRLVLGSGLCAIALLYFFELLVMCDAAHRATATMQLSFASALTSLQMYTLNPDLRCEVQYFLSVLTVSPAGVWVAGFVQVNRQLMGSMMAAMVTYLVVLLQFRQSDEKGECLMFNATLVNIRSDAHPSHCLVCSCPNLAIL